MDIERIYLVSDLDGYSPQIGRLVSMMNYARWTTIESVKDLSIEQLDYQIAEDSNSIGALLLHIAGVEFSYYISTLSGRFMTDSDRDKWMTAMILGEEARERIKHNTLEYYLEALNEVRHNTLMKLKEKTDDWLDESNIEPYLNNRPINNHWRWFHVVEDELSHRGQIRLIRKRIQEAESIR